MLQYGLPVLFALLLWWFTTGLIMVLDHLPRRTFRWSLLGVTVALVLALDGLAWTRGDMTVGGAYAAFGCAVLAWAWVEATFYLGYLTGPRRQRCAHGCSGWRHFGHAIQTSLWHELAILGVFAIVAAITWDAPNRLGLWTFVVLKWMHQSARLNVFLGVRNFDGTLIPEHLSHLRSFFARRRMNPLFPVSIGVSSAVLVWLLHRAASPDPVAATGMTFLAALMALAIFEHALLMIPLPPARLWRWGLKTRSLTVS